MADLCDTNELSEASFLTAVGGTPHRPGAHPKTSESLQAYVEDESSPLDESPDSASDDGHDVVDAPPRTGLPAPPAEEHEPFDAPLVSETPPAQHGSPLHGAEEETSVVTCTSDKTNDRPPSVTEQESSEITFEGDKSHACQGSPHAEHEISEVTTESEKTSADLEESPKQEEQQAMETVAQEDVLLPQSAEPTCDPVSATEMETSKEEESPTSAQPQLPPFVMPSPSKVTSRRSWKPPVSPRGSPARSQKTRDFARTYKLEPTVPKGPELETQRRASLSSYSANTTALGEAAPVDLAKTYKMVPTKPRSPALQTERRASLVSLIRRADAHADAVAQGRDGASLARRRANHADPAKYECKPTVPQSPNLQVAQRASLLALTRVDARAAGAPKEEVDYAKTYKLEPTKCARPRFETEARARAALRPANGVLRRAATQLKADVDLAQTYELKPTVSRRPTLQTELRLAAKPGGEAARAKPEPDLARNYKLEPTRPVALHLSTEQRFVKHKYAASASATPPAAKVQPDYAASYKLEPTKPKSPRMSCFTRTHPTPKSAPALPTRASAPFRANPMPDFGDAKVARVARRHSLRSVPSTPEVRVKPEPKVEPKSAPKLKPTVPTRHQLESERRHDEYVARTRLSLARSASQGSVGKRVKGVWDDVQKLRPTKAEPFELSSMPRHERAMEAWRASVQRQEAALETRRNFKAQPLSADMLEGATFVPATGTAALTRPQDVVTASRDRALRRARYDARNAERVAEDEVRRRQAAAAREEQAQAAEHARLRKHAFKARPVPETTYRRPDPVVSPRTPRQSPGTVKEEPAEAHPREATNSLSPKEIIAGVRRAIERLSPSYGTPA